MQTHATLTHFRLMICDAAACLVVNPLWSCWTRRRTPNQNQHKAKLGTCIEAEIVASCCKQFDLIEEDLEVNSTKSELWKQFRFRSIRIRLHVVLCRVCKPQLIVPHEKDTLSGSANLSGDAKSAVEQVSHSVCGSLSTSVWVSVCISVSVCVCACLGVGVCLIVLVCLADSFKPRCIRAGAVQNSLFACQ